MNEWDHAVHALRDHGRAIGLGALAGFILALCVFLLQPPVWEARATIAPVTRTGMTSLSSFLPQAAAETPALQYFVRRIDAATSTDFALFETLINGPRLAETLSLDGMTAAQKIDWLRKNVRVRGVGATPFRTVTLRHANPTIAVERLSSLLDETDMIIRTDAKEKATRRVAYLRGQLTQTLHPDHRDALITLLKEQEQTLMMASLDDQFAADIVQPPTLAPRPVSPDARLLFPVLIFGGMVIGFLIGQILAAYRRTL